MNIKELLTHVNDNIQNDRNAGHGLLLAYVPSVACTVCNIVWECPDDYSLAPKKVMINSTECVAGMTEAPEVGAKYSRATPLLDSAIRTLVCIWTGSELDYQLLSHGMSFPDTKEGRENAKVMGNAMVSFGEVK